MKRLKKHLGKKLPKKPNQRNDVNILQIFYIFITFMENILTFDEKIIKYIHDVTKILKKLKFCN